MSEFLGRRIAVIGLAATGLAAARVLRDEGAFVTVYDSQPEAKLSAARVAEAQELSGVALRFGTSEIDWNVTDLVIPSPGVPKGAPPLTQAMERGIEIMGEIEAAYRLAKAPIMAITGTNGKTTTTALLGAICSEAGLTTSVAGNIAEDAGVRLPLIEAAVQTPPNGVIVAEISSFQLEWVTTFRPKVAAWLNISIDHMDRHADLAEYAEAKSNILRAQTEEDFAVLNADDENVVLFSEGVGAGKCCWFGTGANTHDLALLYAAYDGVENLTIGDGAANRELLLTRSEISIPGRHNVSNVLAAAAMALSFGIDIEAVRAGIRGFRGVAHRMEPVGEVAGVRFINNSMCTNPAAVAASLEAVGGPMIAIVGGRHKGGDLTPIAEALKTYARHVVLIGEAKGELASLFKTLGSPSYEMAETLPDAVDSAASRAVPGDTVILVPGCASFDMFTGFEHRGQIFRDSVATLGKGKF